MLKRKFLHLTLISINFFLLFAVSEASHQQKPICKHFVLVHGSCLGAWSWYKLIPLLKSSGHKVTAIDLAASGINPLQANDLQSISEYFQPLTYLITSLPSNERVILVGHSLGGLAISHAMEHFPEKIAVSVFVTAQMPGPALSVSTLTKESLKRSGPVLDNQYSYGDGPTNSPTTFIFGPTFLSEQVYTLSPPEDVALAMSLIRPLRLFSTNDMSKVLVLTEEKYGSVPRVYISSGQDKIMNRELEKWMIEKNPPKRVEQIKGSDHMVMVSQPLQLWAQLQNITADLCD